MTDLHTTPEETSTDTDLQVPDPSAPTEGTKSDVHRRAILRIGAAGVTGAAVIAARDLWVPGMARRGLLSPDGAFAAASTAVGDTVFFLEVFPTSPLILSPFTDPLNVPKALAPTDTSIFSAGTTRPARATASRTRCATSATRSGPSDVGSPDPIVYQIDLQVAPHSFTTSQVLPIDEKGKPAVSFDAAGKALRRAPKRTLPVSTIYGFNGTFPGPDDQRRVRQAGPGPLRQPSRREPLRPGPSGLRRARLLLPDPPPQRPHRPGERRQPALRVPRGPRSTSGLQTGSGSTSST